MASIKVCRTLHNTCGAPPAVSVYLNANHNGKKVLYMGREIKNGDITLLLDDGTELHFTNEHQLIK